MSSRSAPLFVLPVLAMAIPTAQAADYVEPAPVFTPINYISVEGGYIWTDHGVSEFCGDKFGDIGDDEGFYAAATYRRIFRPEWDFQATLTGTWLDGDSKGVYGMEPAMVLQDDSNGYEDYRDYYSTDLKFQTLDLDLGYHLNGNPLTRFHVGVRGLHVSDDLFYGADYGYYATKVDIEGWAIGPRIGFQSETMLGGSRFGLVLEGSGSILFGRFDVDRWTDGYKHSYDKSHTIYNIEGLAGLSFHATDKLTITAGYRAQQWWGLRPETSIHVQNNGYRLTADEDILVHGPFARIGLTF